jgi:hypothetical protein
MINDQLMQQERVFLIPRGLPDRPNFWHALYAPAKLFGLPGNFRSDAQH